MFKIVSVKKGKEIKAQKRTVRRSKVCVSPGAWRTAVNKRGKSNIWTNIDRRVMGRDWFSGGVMGGRMRNFDPRIFSRSVKEPKSFLICSGGYV